MPNARTSRFGPSSNDQCRPPWRVAMLDPSALVAFILRRRICGPCMTVQFEAGLEAIEAELRRSKSLTLLKITPSRCDQCGETGTIFSVPVDA